MSNYLVNIEFALMSMEDIDGVMIVENLSFAVPWTREAFVGEVTRNAFATYITAKIEGKVIGYAGMWKIFDEGHITNIAVHPEYRRNRVGAGLVERLIAVAGETGIKRMTLEVRASNIAAIRLYEKYGFTAVGIRKEYYSDTREDAVIMWREGI